MAKKYQLITAKPYLYVANVNNYDNLDDNSALQSVLAYANEKKAPVIVINASLEAELSVLSPEEQIEFLQELGLRQSGLDKLIAAGHTLLDLETFIQQAQRSQGHGQ